MSDRRMIAEGSGRPTGWDLACWWGAFVGCAYLMLAGLIATMYVIVRLWVGA